jgi:hypothetical protein
MRFWLRELAGWLLVGLGLLVFYVSFALLVNHYVTEAGPLVLIGIFIFRGGIHLLKTAVAARVCMHIATHMEQREPRTERARSSAGRAAAPTR